MAKRTRTAEPAMKLRLARYRQVPGQHYGTPKEMWGFLLPAQTSSPAATARATLRANAAVLGIDPSGAGVQLRHVKPTMGGWHVIFGQKHLGIPIHRAYVTVHMNRKKEVYLIKNRAVPPPMLPAAANVTVSARAARGIAVKSVGLRQPRVLTHERMWIPREEHLRLAHKFRIRTSDPAGEWLIYVDALNGRILSKYDNLATATGKALIFNPNPVVALGDWRPLLNGDEPVRRVPAEAYEAGPLDGISKSGRLDGPHVTTRLTRNRLQAKSLGFERRSHQAGFEEVMVYYHLDRAIRYVRSLGYTGARRIFVRPLPVNARATRADQSWYSPGTRSLAFGTGAVDDAEDGETILHEFGHALQDAICPDFGQSLQAAAIGEGFGDYFAASFFAGKKTGRAKPLLPTVMTWDGVIFPDPVDASRPPCVRRLDTARTFESFDHSPDASEHDNGEIWAATLWDIWKAVGRAVADPIVIESHFQLDGFTTFARAARAILDADRHLFKGRHIARLTRIFRRRGIGPVE